MNKRWLMDLGDGWVLTCDNNQWMLCRRRFRQEEEYLQPVSYVGSNKSTLFLLLQEKGVHMPASAIEEVEKWPDRFLDWYDLSRARDV